MAVTMQQSSEVLVTGTLVKGSFSDNVFHWQRMQVPFLAMYEGKLLDVGYVAHGGSGAEVAIDKHLTLPALRDLVEELTDVVRAMEKVNE